MHNAPIPIRRQRQFVLAACTVLLHFIVFRWFMAQLGVQHAPDGKRTAPPVAAQLVDVAPEPPAPKPRLAPPRPRMAPPPPLPDLNPDPVPEPASDAAAPKPGSADAAASAAPAGTPAPGGPDAAPGAAGVPGDAQAAGQAGLPQPTAGSGSAQQQPPPPPPQAPGRHYKIDLPPSADITLDVARTDADGTRWSGEETLSWTLSGDRYTIKVDAGLRVMFARVNLLTVTSEGRLGEDGFIPTLMTEKRRGRSMTATHFTRETNLLTFSASQARYPLPPNLGGYVQDKASVPLQLAAIARGDPKQLSGNLEFLVGEDKDASVFTFTVVGQEQIETRMGRIAAWHLVRPPKPGSYNSRLELWLAPEHGWYPVQIRNVESTGATTTQTVTRIVTKK